MRSDYGLFSIHLPEEHVKDTLTKIKNLSLKVFSPIHRFLDFETVQEGFFRFEILADKKVTEAFKNEAF